MPHAAVVRTCSVLDTGSGMTANLQVLRIKKIVLRFFGGLLDYRVGNTLLAVRFIREATISLSILDRCSRDYRKARGTFQFCITIYSIAYILELVKRGCAIFSIMRSINPYYRVAISFLSCDTSSRIKAARSNSNRWAASFISLSFSLMSPGMSSSFSISTNSLGSSGRSS